MSGAFGGFDFTIGSDWGSFVDIQRNFPSEDLVGLVLIFK
jgi:hypothetical protein